MVLFFYLFSVFCNYVSSRSLLISIFLLFVLLVKMICKKKFAKASFLYFRISVSMKILLKNVYDFSSNASSSYFSISFLTLSNEAFRFAILGKVVLILSFVMVQSLICLSFAFSLDVCTRQ